MTIVSPLLQGLGRAIGVLETRHKVLTENLANVETPGYRARDVDFGGALRAAFARRAERPGEAVPAPQVTRDVPPGPDGNSVDVDIEMGKLSDNAFRLVALSELLGRRYAGLKALVREL